MTANNPSKYYPKAGGQFEPVSIGQFQPVKGGQFQPAEGGQFKPDFAGKKGRNIFRCGSQRLFESTK